MPSSYATKSQDSSGYSTDIKSIGMVERALRNISYGDWRLRIPQQAKIKLVEAHLSKMEEMLPGFKYDYHSMDKFVSSINMLPLEDAKRFVCALESIAYFYSSTFEKDTALLVVTGLLSWPGSAEATEKHRKIILRRLYSKTLHYKKRLSYYDSRISLLYEELQKSNTGIFRFIKKRKAARISALLKSLEPKYTKVKEGYSTHSLLFEKVSGEKPDQQRAPPPEEMQ